MTKQKQTKLLENTDICVDEKANQDIFTTSEFLYNNSTFQGLELKESCAFSFDDEPFKTLDQSPSFDSTTDEGSALT